MGPLIELPDDFSPMDAEGAILSLPRVFYEIV